MENLQMKTGMFRFKKRVARLCLGGMALHLGLFGAGNCGSTASNAALTSFYTGVGNGVVDVTADSAANVGSDFEAIVVQPAAGFFKNLWSTFVGLRIPLDPIYPNAGLVK
jgi:hypothetical protein